MFSLIAIWLLPHPKYSKYLKCFREMMIVRTPVWLVHTAWKVPIFGVSLAFGLNTDWYSIQMREDASQNNSEYGHFLRSGNTWRGRQCCSEVMVPFIYRDDMIRKHSFKTEKRSLPNTIRMSILTGIYDERVKVTK